MKVPEDRRYAPSHQWARQEPDGTVTVGITDYAQDQLGDIVFVELPASGESVKQMEKFGEIESVKAVSELYCPVTGEVLEANTALADNPQLVNDDPYGDGWMLRIRLSDPNEIEKLLSAQDYDEFIAQGAE